MADLTETYLRDQLTTRRQKLELAVVNGKEAAGLRQLLDDVDAALQRMDAGSYGLCESCHESIEKDRLLADPLVRYCLDHLTAAEQRALEADLEMAARIQQELLPKRNLRFAGWETAYHYAPLGPVSGDYCDLVVHENESDDLYFALGDATGKGVAASMLMAQLHAIFRTLIGSGLPVPALVARASRIFCESTMSSLFATLVCGRAGSAGDIEICNAGHCAALLWQNGQVSRIAASGVPLGMFCEGEYVSETLPFTPGDTLLLYTDGISEARAANQEEYGERRLAEVLAGSPASSLPALIQVSLENLKAFRGGVPLHDDLTLLAIRRSR
ncbi:MAG: SpoIIE family protein phosphatase [Acidobacteriia bacterium]|nr:SpoIIE family protein phosphatase [Terriglobia bacterium]